MNCILIGAPVHLEESDKSRVLWHPPEDGKP